jgi:hypothetical protein
MKDIKLISLELFNFKCHAHLKIDFNGRNTSLLGDNATGKTSVYDSLMWTLFGKDSQGNGDKLMEVKPIGVGGEVKDHNAQTAVDVVLSVSGEEITLRRTLQEVWTTRRGCSEAVYTGNVSEYYINSVPVKKNVFSDKVNEIVDEDTFRLLTNVSYFANDISWQERREVLFKVAGVMDDAQIMATDARFQPLIEGMGRLSLEDYKKKMLSEKKAFTGTKTEIPARLSECQKTIEDVQGLNFAAARAEVERLTAQKNAVEAQILAIEHDNAAEGKRLEIREATIAQMQLDGENRAYRNSQTANMPDVSSMKQRLGTLSVQLATKKKMIGNEVAFVEKLSQDIDASRERWVTVNKETFVGGTCPTCGQALPAKQLQAAQEAFEAHKRERLAEIEQTAASRKQAKEAAEDRLLHMKEDVATLEGDILTLEKTIAAAQANVIEPVDMEGYAERRKAIEEQIHSLNGELADMMANSSAVRGDLQKQAAEIRGQIAAQMEIISKESLLDYSRRRMEELREDAANAAKCLEAIEGVLFLIDEYSRYKTQFVENSINGMFRIARFRLFREQANGGVEDRCDVVLDGVPYINLNSGAKINVGIDIINTLSRAYGVTVPLFVDNAESVTALESGVGQIIRLVVSEQDKELRTSYEN